MKVFKWIFLSLAVLALIGAFIYGRVDLLFEALLAYFLSRAVILIK